MTPDADTPRWTLDAMLTEASWLRRLASALVRDPGTADDLVQDTWVATLRTTPPAHVPRRAWLGGVLKNLVRMRARSGARRSAHEAASPPGRAAPDPADVAARLELQRRLAGWVTRLEEPIRTTIALRYYEGLSGADIARRLDVPAGTVRWRLHRGLELLRARLDESHGGRRSAWIAVLAALPAPTVGGLPGAAGVAASATGAAALGGFVMSSTSKAVVAVAALVIVGAVGWSLGASSSDPDSAPSAPPTRTAEAPPAAAQPTLTGQKPRASSAPPLATSSGKPTTSSTLQGRARVTGRVVDESGAPLAATVRDLDASGSTATSDDGRFDLQVGVAFGGTAKSIELAAQGHATRLIVRTATSHDALDLGDVVLLAGVDVVGRVVDEHGEGVPHAWVAVARRATGKASQPNKGSPGMPSLPPPPPASGLSAFGPGATPLDLFTAQPVGPLVIADADGRFVVPGLPEGAPSVLRAGSSGHWTASATVTPATGVEATIVCRHLAPDEGIEGRVLMGDGTPVARCAILVKVESASVRGTFVAWTDASGAFHVDTLGGATYTLSVSDVATGLVSTVSEGLLGGRRDVTLVARVAPTILIGASSEDGTELAAFTWTLEVDGRTLASGSQADRRVFRPAGRFTVTVDAPGHVRGSRAIETGDTGEQVVVSLRAVPAWTGIVLAGGAPARGARVALHRVPPAGRTTLANGFALTRAFMAAAETTTDASGRYRVAIPEAGRWLVAATHDGFATGDAEAFETEASSTGTLPTIALGRGGTIEGTVAPQVGRSQGAAIVGASRGDGRVLVARADAAGAFRFESLTPGPWAVRVLAAEPRTGTTAFATTDEPPTWNATVEEGRATRVDLAAPPAGTCTVLGRLSSDVPKWSASIDFADVGRGQTETTPVAVAADGTFRIETDLTGPHLLTFATNQGALRVHVPVRLSPGEMRVDLTLDLGTVEVAADGPLADGRTMLVWEGAGGTYATSNLRRGGAGRLAALVPAGRVRIVGYEDGVEEPDPRRWTTRVEVDVPRGGTVTAAMR